MAPLRDAMRFINGKERDTHRGEQGQAAIGEQSLGRHIQQVDVACTQRLLDAARLGQ